MNSSFFSGLERDVKDETISLNCHTRCDFMRTQTFNRASLNKCSQETFVAYLYQLLKYVLLH